MANLESFKKKINPSDDVTMTDAASFSVTSEAEADAVMRDLSMQALLQLGSRSFSHFLNIVER